MKIEDYQKIVKTIRTFRGLTKDCAKMLIKKYNSFDPDTLNSILGNEIQLKMKINHKRMFGRNNHYYDSYLEASKNGEPAGILLRLAQQLDTCPALLALEVLKDYGKSINISQKKLNMIMKDTTLIEKSDLAYEIYMCILFDDQYGYMTNTIRQSIGDEYEVKLENYLIEKNIPFSNEDHLRIKGYDKTPDCKLEVPIAVNGFVVNWIESKALFGSPQIHEKYIKEQFLSYWNRFGPGLVIYWFGFLDNISQSSETRFIIMDHFPENITYMDPSSIK